MVFISQGLDKPSNGPTGPLEKTQAEMGESYLALRSIVEISGLSPSPRQTAQPTIQRDHTQFEFANVDSDLAIGLLAGAHSLLETYIRY